MQIHGGYSTLIKPPFFLFETLSSTPNDFSIFPFLFIASIKNGGPSNTVQGHVPRHSDGNHSAEQTNSDEYTEQVFTTEGYYQVSAV